MTLKGAVEIEAYTSDKKLVLRQVFPVHEWYDQSHPIVDSDDERARLRVSSMQGKQYDDNGELEQYWRNTYAESGAIIKMSVWRKDGSRENIHFQS